ncbi:MAG: hypothetical protein CVT81_14520 [Alphaproteobacteria bacterium HGW-Alphaproteobacteria-3]|nr:MAG: hypothetical protein CVT81_14520 [Alphaproteobacteria bacterium HGW-Alphaproteobacteria-3]
MKDTFRIGDRVTDGAITGKVVCLIGAGEFTSDYPASQWGYLESGLLVLSEDASLVYFPDAGLLRRVE